MFKLSSLLSIIFRITLIFLIVFIWARYYIDSLYIAIIVSCLGTIMIDLFIKLIRNKHDKTLSLKRAELEKIESINNTFLFGDENETLMFFYNLALKKHNAIKKKDYILIEHDNGEKIVLMPFYTYRKVNVDDLILCVNKIKKIGPTKLVLCVSSADSLIYKFVEKLSLEIVILNKEETYLKLLSEYNFYPDNLINLKEVQKNNIKTLVSYSLNKSRTKGYFLASCIMLFSSFLVRYNIYYIIFSTFLLILSLISFINPRFNKKIPKKILD